MISEFNRNKVINVSRLDDATLAVHGILDDSIYSLELDFKVNIDGLTCFDVAGRWLRWTTPECPEALKFLAQAEGFCLQRGIDEKIHKIIGRTACRHFANLFIECAYAVRETVKLLHWQQARAEGSELSFKEFLQCGGAAERVVAADVEATPARVEAKVDSAAVAVSDTIKERSAKSAGNSAFGKDAFVIDLHIHTSPASPCASDSAAAMIIEAKRIGLQGICLTDHNYLWSESEIEALRREHDFPVFRANEIVTEQGDVLVFGFYEDVQGIIKLKELKRRVAAAGGFIVAAHPFRGFLTFGADDIGLTSEKAASREMFKLVDGIEVLNGKVTETENGLAQEVVQVLNLSATGGSDAHDVSTVGFYATAFTQAINSDKELVAVLHQGSFQPVKFR